MRRETIYEQDSLLQDSQLKIFLSKDNRSSNRLSKSVSIIQPKLNYDSQIPVNAKKLRVGLAFSNRSFNSKKFDTVRQPYARKMSFSKDRFVVSPGNRFQSLLGNNSRIKNQGSNPENLNGFAMGKRQFITSSQPKIRSKSPSINRSLSRELQNSVISKTKLPIGNQTKLRSQLKSACSLDKRVDFVINQILTGRCRPTTQLQKKKRLSLACLKPKSEVQKEKQFRRKHHILRNPFLENLEEPDSFKERIQLAQLL